MWLYKDKYNADGSLNWYKARIVANGRSQQQGIDCEETFSPVVKPATIRTVLSLAVYHEWPIHQLDVKNAFLHGHLHVVKLSTTEIRQSLDFAPARLVANGSSQQQGIDVDETFSPVVKLATIHTVLSLVVSRKWPVHQLDVKNAFLNGNLSETVYMHQPPGFTDPQHPNHVCLLQRSLYGLKQAPHAWFQHFAALLQQIITSLHQEFDMTDLGALNYFLGISATRSSTGLFLSQKKYACELLERANMVNYNPSQTPIDTDSKLGPEGVAVQDPTLYRSL
nr:ribonuclease H-like domain-containing protein [Tanacetum cinerariifolium]